MRLLLPLVLVAVGCDAAASDAAPPAATVVSSTTQASVDVAAPRPIYSPFVIDVDPTAPFSLVSFKDVGMSLSEGEQSFAYEALAEGLAQELRTESLLSMVRHAADIADPANHLACDGGHVYVDVWRAEGGWGYSLWSGCGEDDRFAHRELTTTGADRVASLSHLARDMAQQLQSAVETGCFTRYC